MSEESTPQDPVLSAIAVNHIDVLIFIPHKDGTGIAHIFDPKEPVPPQSQYPILKKPKKQQGANISFLFFMPIWIPRANLNIAIQPPPQPTPAAKMIMQTPFATSLGFVSSTGVLDDPDSGHRHPTYLHSSGMHGHHHPTHNKDDLLRVFHRQPAHHHQYPALENQLQTLAISPKLEKKKLEAALQKEQDDTRKKRPQTAPAAIKSSNVKMAVYAEDYDMVPHHVNLRPRSENPVNMRPQSARVATKKATYEYSGPMSSYQLMNPFLAAVREPSAVSLAAAAPPTNVPDTYYSLRASKQPTAPVAPTIVRTQTVRSNLDSFSIEKVALRRLRFVVENNECDVEHLSLVDLIEAGQVPAPIITSFFGAEYATPHDLRVLLLQSIDKARRIRNRRKKMGAKSPSPDPILPSEHPIHDQPPPNKGLSATFHHTHPHYNSPATPIASYSTYTTQSFPQPNLCSATTPSEIVSRDTRSNNFGNGDANNHDFIEPVPRVLEDKHEVQALLMLTHTTSDAAANIFVGQEMKIAASAAASETPRKTVGSVSGRQSVMSMRSVGSAKSRHSNATTAATTTASGHRRRMTNSRGDVDLPRVGSLSQGGRITPVPATCMPSRALTPTAMVIATDASKSAVLNVKAVRRVTTPNEILDVLRQVEGPQTVLKGVVGEGWAKAGSGSGGGRRRRRNGDGKYENLEDIVLRNMDLRVEGSVTGRSSFGSNKGTSLKSAMTGGASSNGSSRNSVKTKKQVRLLAEEPSGGEPDFMVSLDFLPRPKNDASSAVNEQHMLRIIERRRSRYLIAGV
ncbi:hypothetical protein BDR26DRAFT_856798 [Obelidium mucronatum]|nr:hypothetical protein BDR26DRAFT_856798 [Obelidium mucronatum]